MSALKSVVIAFSKGLSTTKSNIVGTNEIVKPVQKFHFSTCISPEKLNMEIAKKATTRYGSNAHDDNVLFKTDVCLRGKKRRLDHLTWEEKLQRKKLKNRVAAQTSRDRKKAKLDELEENVRTLKERNEMLSQECTTLKSQNESLILENKNLRREMVDGSKQLCMVCQARVAWAVPSSGSAVSPVNSLPQSGAVQLTPSLTLTPGAAILLKILTLYLLSKNCSVSSKETTTFSDSKNLQKAFCERLPLKWKEILLNQMNKCRSQKITFQNSLIRKTWWGSHQRTWNPKEPLIEAT